MPGFCGRSTGPSALAAASKRSLLFELSYWGLQSALADATCGQSATALQAKRPRFEMTDPAPGGWFMAMMEFGLKPLRGGSPDSQALSRIKPFYYRRVSRGLRA